MIPMNTINLMNRWFRDQGLGCRVCVLMVEGLAFMGLGFRVQTAGFRV